ncbi:Hypothetical protein Ccan_06700 [Capnocytophaga canimorsus Cc5]|uniref:Uncharacterized protein n=1 Tax=Capnocytophaga canimorsus (strain 5) TaxID=860228 RepID=F9YT48_CAPCC|nr:Hypothetical protein Ccan_06700 [Capnocytophaga canimorsus Cc5]
MNGFGIKRLNISVSNKNSLLLLKPQTSKNQKKEQYLKT